MRIRNPDVKTCLGGACLADTLEPCVGTSSAESFVSLEFAFLCSDFPGRFGRVCLGKRENSTSSRNGEVGTLILSNQYQYHK